MNYATDWPLGTRLQAKDSLLETTSSIQSPRSLVGPRTPLLTSVAAAASYAEGNESMGDAKLESASRVDRPIHWLESRPRPQR